MLFTEFVTNIADFQNLLLTFAGMKIQGLLCGIVVVVLGLLTACSTMTAAERAEKALAVERALASRHYVVDVQMMYPRRGRAVNVTSNYSLEIKGDTVVSYLPYFGRAYSIPYGGGKVFNFSAPIISYESARDRKGKTYVRLVTDNEEDVITFQLEIFDNGQATIDVRAREREPITYSGELE